MATPGRCEFNKKRAERSINMKGLVIGNVYVIEFSRFSRKYGSKEVPNDMVCKLVHVEKDIYISVEDRNKIGYHYPWDVVWCLKDLGKPKEGWQG